MTRDLMYQQEIRRAVRQAYAGIPAGGGEPVTRSYTDDELALVPAGAINRALGVGNPVRYAALQPGETVLDVGGGIDTVLAARRVGHPRCSGRPRPGPGASPAPWPSGCSSASFTTPASRRDGIGSVR
jgi:hypothetical protein